MFDLTIQDRSVPTEWDFDTSARKAHRLLGNWRKITVEMLQEMWVARKSLSRDGRPETGAFSWAAWCERVGVTKSTANRWLAAYDPETGAKRSRLVEPKPKKLAQNAPVSAPEKLAQNEGATNSQLPVVLNVSEERQSLELVTVPKTVTEILSRALDSIPTLKNLPPVSDSEKEQVRALAKKIQNRCTRILNSLGSELSGHEKDLLDDVVTAFRSQQDHPGDFDYKREFRPARELVAKAMTREDPEDFLRTFLETYHSLTHSEDRFWNGQPFLPSSAVSLYPRVTKQMSNGHSKKVRPEHMAAAGRIKW